MAAMKLIHKKKTNIIQ